MPRQSPFAALVGLLALPLACGPSLQVRHENDLRFEHCYRLDADPKIAPSHRSHCWKDWTQNYAMNQPLDRVEYARRRVADLDSGDTRTITIHAGKGPERRVFEEHDPEPMAAPMPTNVHAPPPRTEPLPAPLGPDGGASARPGAACAETCEGDLDRCYALCATKHADCGACREDYRRCMRRCYE